MNLGWDGEGARSLVRVGSLGARALAGLLLGALAGLATTLAVVVLRALLEEVFLHSTGELVGWVGVPLVVLPFVGLWLGVRGGPAFQRAVVAVVAGLLAGTAVGVLIGWLGGEPTGPWAGGIVGAAGGLVVAAVGAWARSAGRGRATRRGSGVAASLAFCATVASASCGDAEPDPLPAPGQWEQPAPADVESVVFFVGDAGMARTGTSPVLARIREEVDTWAAELRRDSAVAVVVLGDIVYPNGMNDPDHGERETDSARVAAQVSTVAGDAARRWGARAVFVAGNHDWGQEEHLQGVHRLENLDAFLDARRRFDSVAVFLRPEAGSGGPAVLDLGERLRLLFLDTAWWLLEGDPREKHRVVEGVEALVAGAGDREIVVAAHHPFASGGPHGDLLTFGRTLGLRTLLARSGALLQDLYSAPYRDLRYQLRGIFRRERAPAVFAGGHEHSLQVIRGDDASSPRVSLVAGSASKLTSVGPTAGAVFARSAPGFARLFALKDGTLFLTVVAAPPRFLSCPEDDAAACMAEGVAAYRTVWAGPV